MEVNRLNPTKSIRIGGISHFAFVNGWLLRSWGRSCIAGDASKARLRSCRLAAAVGTHRGRGRCDLLQFVEKAVLRKREEPHCWGPEGAMEFERGFALAVYAFWPKFPVRLRADGLRRTRKYTGTSARVRFWGARRSVRGCLAPRFRLHRRTEPGRQRHGRTAFRG